MVIGEGLGPKHQMAGMSLRGREAWAISGLNGLTWEKGMRRVWASEGSELLEIQF